MEPAALWIPIGIVLFILLWSIVLYNGLVRHRNHVRESWSNIDTELKRRYDLIPNLVGTVKGYAAHEKEVLERVTKARAAAIASTGSPASQAEDENVLVGALRQVFAVAESYPKLRASDNFLRLQEDLTHTEDRIQRARRFYNGNVRDLNVRIETFPSAIIASMFGFERAEFFEIDEAIQREAPKVQV
jgi:LemA protein